MEAKKSIIKKPEHLIDPDLISFFDLLAKFDYEDKQKAEARKKKVVSNNSNKNPDPRATRQNSSYKTSRDN